MEFRFTEDQNELRTQARRFLAAESTAAHVDKAMKTELGYDAAVWQRVATELGWPALVIPEAQDGIARVERRLTMLEQPRPADVARLVAPRYRIR